MHTIKRRFYGSLKSLTCGHFLLFLIVSSYLEVGLGNFTVPNKIQQVIMNASDVTIVLGYDQ